MEERRVAGLSVRRSRAIRASVRVRSRAAGVEQYSIFDAASTEAYRHKWLESEKAGYDMGDSAIEDWHKRYWHAFLRERWVQHIKGVAFWRELDNGDFNIMNTEFADCKPEADAILARIEQGAENLDIIQWAVEENCNMDVVLRILSRLDLNAHRIAARSNDSSGREFARVIRSRHVPRALLVDDDPDCRLLLRAVLEHEKMDVVEAATGEEAMEIVQTRRFDLFVLDLRLPRRHGAEIAYYLRRHGIQRYVVAIGASLDEWHECDLYDCGFTHLLRKPFPLPRLAAIAREVISTVHSQ